MPQTTPAITGGESSCFITPKGGVVSLTGDPPRVAGLERITTCPQGVAFGPLKISTPDLADDAHTVTAIENLRFAPTQDDEDDDESLFSWGDDNETDTNTTTSGLLGLSLVGGAAATDDETTMTRREAIGATVGILALAGIATASAQDTTAIKFAEFDLVRSDGPTHVGVLPIIETALPADTELTLAADGTERAEWTPTSDDPAGETIVLEDGQQERVKVYAEGGVSDLKATMAWAKGILASGDEIKATLELGTDPTTLDEGDAVVIDDHPAFVEPLRADKGEESVVTLGGESIPHETEEWGRERGYYEISEDDALVYVRGTDPPEGTIVELRLRAGSIASLTDSIERL